MAGSLTPRPGKSIGPLAALVVQAISECKFVDARKSRQGRALGRFPVTKIVLEAVDHFLLGGQLLLCPPSLDLVEYGSAGLHRRGAPDSRPGVATNQCRAGFSVGSDDFGRVIKLHRVAKVSRRRYPFERQSRHNQDEAGR